ncbi:MAG: VOC family protein [Gemmatimonadaceae bacterium]|nr:VOC family protein [Gemmatimonadaceae bacterium]
MGASLDERFGNGNASAPASAGSYGIQPPSYRLPDQTRIAGVTLQVTDLARSRAYYETVLGFRALAQSANRVTLGTAAPDSDPLVTLVERRRTTSAPKSLGLYHFAILLPTREALGAFVRHLGEMGVRAGAGDHLVSEAFYLQDPDDLGIEVYADRPRDTWQRRNRELVMATDPVDVPALLTAATGTRWTGMPAGTTIGHVHLHVGHLDEAARFYSDALGFDRMVWSYPSALFLAAGGYHHHLGTNTWAGPAARPAAPDAPQLLEWRLELPSAEDVSAAAASLRSAGYAADTDGTHVTTRDPWGTGLRLLPR